MCRLDVDTHPQSHMGEGEIYPAVSHIIAFCLDPSWLRTTEQPFFLDFRKAVIAGLLTFFHATTFQCSCH